MSEIKQQHQDLVREVEILRQAVRRFLSERTTSPPDEGFAICKLLPGLESPDLQRIIHDPDLLDWLAVPMGNEEYPHLVHLLQRVEELASRVASDPETGLALWGSFLRHLDLEVERAHRHSTPLSIAVLEIANPGDDISADVMTRVAGIIVDRKRSYDLAALDDHGRIALAFPGLGMHKAKGLLSRVLDIIATMQPDIAAIDRPLKCSVGIASYKGMAETTPAELLELAEQALQDAQESSDSAIVMAPLPDLAVSPKHTLVHSNEKRFLFTGKP